MATNKKLSAVITIGGAISGSLRSAFGGVKGRLGDLGKTVTDLEKRQRLLGRAIQEFGRAGKNVTGMRNRYAELTTELDRTRKAHERL
ncbi:phage tail tape measure protein, partial [Escherichia coli]|nr:phage tail tape measure protein [Escherichia coli]